jgi:hypothetical protein
MSSSKKSEKNILFYSRSFFKKKSRYKIKIKIKYKSQIQKYRRKFAQAIHKNMILSNQAVQTQIT